MSEPTDILIGIGVAWFAIAIVMLILNRVRPGRIISIKAIVILGTIFILIALISYSFVLITSGLGHSACGARQARAAFPLLFVGLFVVPTVLLCMYRWYRVSRMRVEGAP